MSVTLSDSMTEASFRRFQAMMVQGRPLILENGNSVRAARWPEMLNPWRDDHERITTLFKNAVTEAQQRSPGENRTS